MGPDDAIDLFFYMMSQKTTLMVVFVMLNEHDVRELVPPIGLMKIMSFVVRVIFSDN